MKQDNKFILMNRDEFKEWLFKSNFTRKIDKIQNHHTYVPNYKTFNGNNHFELTKNMENYHIKFGGMSEIAQNITLFSDGMIMICRSFDKDPAGIYGQNTGSICIENVGNFNIGGDVMTEEHKKTIVFLNACLAMKFNIPINTDHILYHAWFKLKSGGYKTCPGTNFFGGNTKEKAQLNFYPLINNVINQFKNPTPVKTTTQNINYPTVKLGDKNDYVKKMQQALNNKGYKVTVDGIFGNGTLEILKTYQQKNKIVSDGICGLNTWKLLLA